VSISFASLESQGPAIKAYNGSFAWARTRSEPAATQRCGADYEPTVAERMVVETIVDRCFGSMSVPPFLLEMAAS
jgi:hypothetical protein